MLNRISPIRQSLAFPSAASATLTLPWILLMSSVIWLSGCSKSAISQLRTNTPEEAAAKVMELHDANKDGKLNTGELEKVPSIAGSLAQIDANRDKSIDAAEMQARFAAHDSMKDLAVFEVQIRENGRPVSEVVVTFTPEPFMGEGKQSYRGTASHTGACYLVGQDVKLPGIPLGFYQVSLDHDPSNMHVKRGCEVASDLPTSRGMAFDTVRENGAQPTER